MTSEEINSIVKNIISICSSDSEDIEAQLGHIIKETYNNGYLDGRESGYSDGYDEGYENGYDLGSECYG